MRPDQRWFPTSRAERAAWFRNFAQNFESVGPELGFTRAQIDSVNADNDVLQFAAATVFSLDRTMQAVRGYERLMAEGRVGSPQPEFPNFTPPPLPKSVPPGIFERLEKLVRRIRVAPSYTAATGAALGIIPKNRQIANLAEFTPKLTVRVNPAPHSINVRCPRGRFRIFDVWIQRDGRSEWEEAAVLASSPADVDIKPTTQGKPEKISVRTRMRSGQNGVGNFSNIVEVTLNG